MNITPDKEQLSKLMTEAEAGELVLPEFQRSFVWNRQDVEELIVSIMNGYYIGTFLLLDINPTDTPFSPRGIEGLETELKPRRMILDGQQRITSIFYALNSHKFDEKMGLGNTKYAYEFFVDMKSAVDNDWEDAVFSRKIGGRKHNKYDTDEKCIEQNVVPMRALRDGESRMKWGIEYKEEKNEGLWKEFEKYAKNFNNFFVSTVELNRDTSLDVIVEIFERINRTGQNLSIFELLTARLYSEDILLRELWEDVYTNRDEFGHIHEFSKDIKDEKYQKHILSTMALIRDKEPKRKNLITLDSKNFVEDWETASKYVEKALIRLVNTKDGFGVISPSWLPYSGMVPALASMLQMINSKDSNNNYNKLKKWYWSSVFTERYSSSTGTLSKRDLEELEKWIDNGDKPEAIITENQINELTLKESSKRSGIYKGIICMIALETPRDFFSGDSVEFHKLEDHHIFPKKYLEDQNEVIGKERRNTVLNRTLIQEETNRKISAKEPSKYIQEMLENLESEKTVKKVLSNHLIGRGAYHAMKENNYKEFLNARENEIKNKIKHKTVAK